LRVPRYFHTFWKVTRAAKLIIALVLVIAWPVVTSHAWLQQIGWIHHSHEEHGSAGHSHEHLPDNHEFADGDYAPGSAFAKVLKPASLDLGAFSLWSGAEPGPRGERAVSGNPLVRAGPSPPGLLDSLHFALRTAQPTRAPSLAS
jgi:hypothetical protein